MPDQGEARGEVRGEARGRAEALAQAAVNPGLTAEDVAEIDAAGLR